MSETMAASRDDATTLRVQAALGREHVVQNFDERVSAARLKEIYESVLIRASTRNRTQADSFVPC